MRIFPRYAVIPLLASTAYAAEFTVKVGANGLTFAPNSVNAAAGDTIIFEFHPKNHTLTQSTLANPCTPIANGGNSGYMPVAATATVFPTKRLVVQDSTTPLWWFCEQAGHCQQGMVFALNPGSQEKMDTFLSNAVNSGGGGATTTPASTAATPSPTDAGGKNGAVGSRVTTSLSGLLVAAAAVIFVA